MSESTLTTPKLERQRPLNVTIEDDRSDRVEVAWIPVSDLVSDTRYQRKLEPSKVYKIATTFDPDAFGTLVISKREDGTLAIIDGGHRVAALYDLGWEDQTVPAVIHTGLTIEDEARVFATLNSNRTKPKAGDIHKADVIAKNPDAVAIQDVFDKFGVKVINYPGNGLRSIGTVYRLYKHGGSELIEGVIDVLLRAYVTIHTDTFFHDVMTVIGAIMYEYPTIDKSRLAKSVASMGSPRQVFSRGQSIAAVSGTKSINETANQIIMAYNKGLRANRLDILSQTGNLFPKRK